MDYYSTKKALSQLLLLQLCLLGKFLTAKCKAKKGVKKQLIRNTVVFAEQICTLGQNSFFVHKGQSIFKV